MPLIDLKNLLKDRWLLDRGNIGVTKEMVVEGMGMKRVIEENDLS